MIFVTVGTQLPFDRLVGAVDRWAGDNPGIEVYAQIGDGAYRPRHMRWAKFLNPAAFHERLGAAELVVSHAGIGNLLLALQSRKPLLVMPRRADLNEHRNDHQRATVKRFGALAGVRVAEDEAELKEALGSLDWRQAPAMPAAASPELLATIREFIERS